MKTKLFASLIMGVMMSALVVSPVGAIAEADQSRIQGLAEAAATQLTTSQDNVTSGVAERVQQRKSQHKAALSAAKQKRIAERCKNSQTVIKEKHDRVVAREAKRTTSRSDIVDRLTKLSERLDSKKPQTELLTSQISDLKVKIEAHKTQLAKYTQTVNDLTEMDCSKDAIGFSATLNDARNELKATRQSNADIRTYINETIQQTLVTISKDLGSTGTNKEGN